MPISEDIVKYYRDLSTHINERQAALFSQEQQEIDFFDKGALLNVLQALDGTMLPSKALLLHMTTLETAISYYQDQRNGEDVLEEKITHLKEEITVALRWFKYQFIGRVYAEIDAHFVHGLAFGRIGLSDIGVNQEASYLSPYTEAITSWFIALKGSVDGLLEFEDDVGNFDDAYLHMQRIQATHDRMVNARQSRWIVSDAASALENLIEKVSEMSGMSGANSVTIEDVTAYKALYQHIQPFITNLSLMSPFELAARQHKVPDNLDEEICAVFEGTDETGKTVKMDAALASKWLSGLGPLRFFDLNLLRKGQVHPLVDMFDQQQELLSDLGDDNWQYKFDNKNLLVINDVFKQVANCTANGYSDQYESPIRPKFVDNAKDIKLSEPTEQLSATELFDTVKRIEKNRCEMTFLSQVTDALLEVLATNHQLSQKDISLQEMRKISNFVTLLKVYFSDTDAIDIEENLTLTDLLEQFQNYIDKKEPYASLLTDHYIELLEKVSLYLNGDQNLANRINKEEKNFIDMLSKHESINFKALPAAAREEMLRELQSLQAFIHTTPFDFQKNDDVIQCLALLEACLNRQENTDFVCADAIAWLDTIEVAAQGKLGQLQILSGQIKIDLYETYQIELESSPLIKGKKTLPLTMTEKNSWLIDATNTIKNEIERTLAALPKSFRLQIQTKNYSEKVDGMTGVVKKEISLTSVYALAFKIFNDLNLLRDELFELSQEPYHAALYQEILARIYNNLHKIDEDLMFRFDISAQTEILVQQIKHYAFLLKGQFPSDFNEHDVSVEKFIIPSKELQKFFNGLPRHWLQKLSNFQYQDGGLHSNIFDIFTNLEQEERNLEKLMLPCTDENAEAHELCYYWRQRWNCEEKSLVNKELFELAETLQPRPSHYKVKIATLIESMSKEESFALSEQNKKLMLSLNKKKRLQIKPIELYKNFWQVSLPKALAALNTFEIENHLSIGSVSEFVYRYWDARKNAMVSKDANKISFCEKYQMENDKHFSLLTLEHLNKTLLEPKRSALNDLQQEKKQLEEFGSEIKKLNQFWFRADDKLSQFLFYTVSWFTTMGDVEYLECRRNIQKQFLTLQKSLVLKNNAITTDYLHNFSTIQQKFPVLESTVRQVLDDLNRKITVMRKELASNEELTTFYQTKHDNYCSKPLINATPNSTAVALPKAISQLENHKQKLIEQMANKLVAESFRAFLTDKNVICFGKSSKLSREISGLVLGGEKNFVDKFNAAMTKAMSIKVQAILNSKELMSKSGEELKTHLEEHLENEYQIQLNYNFYYLQLYQIKLRVDLFKAYLKDAEWYIENEDSKNAKLKVLASIDKALSSSCENKEKGIVNGCGLDMQQRFKNVKNILLQDYDKLIDDKARQELQKSARDKLSADMELNWADYSQTLLYIAYWIAKSYRILKGVLFRTRITNQKEVLVDHLINLVAVDDDTFVQDKVIAADLAFEDKLLQQFQTQATLREDITEEIDIDVSNALNTDGSRDGWGAIKRVFATPAYQLFGMNYFNPALPKKAEEKVEVAVLDTQEPRQPSSVSSPNL